MPYIDIADNTTLNAVLAQLGIDNPSTADRTTIMNFLLELRNVMGTQNPSISGTDTIMNFLKKLDSKSSGINWDSKVPRVAYASKGDNYGTTTLLDITGSGYLISFGANNSGTITVIVDGLTLGSFRFGDAMIPALFKFNSSLKITFTAAYSNGASGMATYVLG